MTLEETLASIDTTLKNLLTVAMTGAAATAELGKPEAPKTRTKKAELPPEINDGRKVSVKLVAGDPEGTRYFLIAKHNTAARILPGEVVPTIEGTIEIDGDEYTAKRAEFAKKSVTAAPTVSPAKASAPAATASTASSSGASVSFKQVVDKLVELSKDTRPGKGREAITAFVAKHGVAKVPALEALGKNAELLAEAEAMLAPDAVDDDVFA